jgi:hypothetical protein
MIITRTPFRMSFFGGGTDMESFFRRYGGAVISTTFDKYCYVNVRHLPRFFDYSTELSYAKTERVTSVDAIEHPAIRNAMKMLDMHEIRLTYDHPESELSVVDGVSFRSLIFLGEPDKHGTRDQMYYWDLQKKLPAFETGKDYLLRYTGKTIIGWQPA